MSELCCSFVRKVIRTDMVSVCRTFGHGIFLGRFPTCFGRTDTDTCPNISTNCPNVRITFRMDGQCPNDFSDGRTKIYPFDTFRSVAQQLQDKLIPHKPSLSVRPLSASPSVDLSFLSVRAPHVFFHKCVSVRQKYFHGRTDSPSVDLCPGALLYGRYHLIIR